MSKIHWDSGLYDDAHGYISRYGLELLSLLSPKAGERICDAGCATGDLSYRISQTGAEVIGIDSSSDMVLRAGQKYHQLRFVKADIVSLPFQDEFDGVVSNAVLHWVKDAEPALSSIYRALKPGGRLAAEMGGKDNVAAIVSAICRALDKFGFSQNRNKHPWVFFSIGEYAPLLEKAGFRISEMNYFDRPTELEHGEKGLANWLSMFGDTFFYGVPIPVYEEMVRFIESELKDELFKGGHWYADYKRLRFRAEKKAAKKI